MADLVTTSTANSEKSYVISNIFTPRMSSGATIRPTRGTPHQANPAIILNDENGVEQAIVSSAEQYPTYMTIAINQSQSGSQTSRTSSRSRRGQYTSLHHSHTYESIGNTQVGAAQIKQSDVSKCTGVTIITVLIITLVVALATLAIATFTVWYLINEVKDIKDLLGKFEGWNCTVESVIESGELPTSEIISTL